MDTLEQVRRRGDREERMLQELPPEIKKIMGFSNPRMVEYDALDAYERDQNDMSWMGARYTDCWYTDLPSMSETDHMYLNVRRLDNLSVADQQAYLARVIRSGDVSRMQDALLTYEALVRKHWHGEDHTFERETRLKESDPETIRAFNDIVAQVNREFPRMRDENDIEALKVFYHQMDALVRREWKYDREITEAFFHDKLNGKVLVDCGGNRDTMLSFAKKFGVKTYINVDKHVYTDDVEVENVEGITVIRVGMDMLQFLAQLSPGSVSITMNGIDSELITNPLYHKALAEEIERVVADGGIIFGSNSTALKVISENIFDIDSWKSDKHSRLDPVIANARVHIFAAA